MSKSQCYQISSRIKNFFNPNKIEHKWSLNSPEKIEKFCIQQEAIRAQTILSYLSSRAIKHEYQDDSMAINDTTGSIDKNIDEQATNAAQKSLSGSMYTAIKRLDSRTKDPIKNLDKFDEADAESCLESGSFDDAYSDISIGFEDIDNELMGCVID